MPTIFAQDAEEAADHLRRQARRQEGQGRLAARQTRQEARQEVGEKEALRGRRLQQALHDEAAADGDDGRLAIIAVRRWGTRSNIASFAY